MDKHFNTAGPGSADLHYLVDPPSRVSLGEFDDLIEQRRYFVLHALRQTGKTTCLLALRDCLNAAGDHAALYVNLEPAQAARNDVYNAVRTVVDELARQSKLVLGNHEIERGAWFSGLSGGLALHGSSAGWRCG